jgi:hypothetical protein
MRSHVIVLLAFLGPIACRREAPPTEPQPSPAAEPTTWSELPPQPTGITATEVCDHVLGIMTRELGEALPMSAEDVTKFRGECIKEMNVEQAKLGDEEFQRQAECVIGADSFAAMEACDAADPGGSGESEALCKHVIEILNRELGTSTTMTAQESEQLLRTCVTEADKERATMPPEKAAQQRDCIFAASTLAELERCDTDSP